MAPTDRDLCCCCIRLRPAVVTISIVYLCIIAATTYQKYSANNTGDQVAKYVIFISAGLQVLIALLGLVSAATKVVFITKTYTYLWWLLTLVVLALSIGNVYLVARNDRMQIEYECLKSLTSSDGMDVSASQIYNCYRTVVVISAVVLGVQFIIMCLIGWVNQRFLREVQQDAAIKAALKSVDEPEEEAA
ncbi:hypothetical protein BG015_003408 [Linnemannia schmuckeri]|uniref:Uncharacterized protein n=1 Tax=Linnemannia schmuckeri TaxID=64567 RepID=A0A9P5S2T4_9FUNG|nr:hypothetical protein BG015_003408 [Linnemannia schmuckeri]